jgi:hypothetical protein
VQRFTNMALAYFIRSFNVSSMGNEGLFFSFMGRDTIQIDGLDFDLPLFVVAVLMLTHYLILDCYPVHTVHSLSSIKRQYDK